MGLYVIRIKAINLNFVWIFQIINKLLKSSNSNRKSMGFFFVLTFSFLDGHTTKVDSLEKLYKLRNHS